MPIIGTLEDGLFLNLSQFFELHGVRKKQRVSGLSGTRERYYLQSEAVYIIVLRDNRARAAKVL